MAKNPNNAVILINNLDNAYFAGGNASSSAIWVSAPSAAKKFAGLGELIDTTKAKLISLGYTDLMIINYEVHMKNRTELLKYAGSNMTLKNYQNKE